MKKFKLDINDIMLIAGVSIFAYGIYQIYQPAAALFIGAVFVKLAMAGEQDG